MTAQPDLKSYAIALAEEQWPVAVPCEVVDAEPYKAPPARGDYFVSNLPYEIAEDEPEIRVEYTYSPAEEQTRDYPGCPADAEIDAIVGLSRDLTAEEEAAALTDREFMEQLETEALEQEINPAGRRRGRAMDAFTKWWRD